MDVEVLDDGRKGMYFTQESGKVLGKLIFRWSEKTVMVLEHTEVFPDQKGKGVGLALMEKAVEQARGEGFQLVASCPFAKKVFERHTEWHDVLQT